MSSSVTCRPVRKAPPPPPTKPPPAPPVARNKPSPAEDTNVAHTNDKIVKTERLPKEPEVKMRTKGHQLNHADSQESQTTSRKNRPPLSRDSISFTTEDMDLFDRRKREDSGSRKNGIKAGARAHSKKDKRRSKSVGAPGFAGIKMRPAKPPVPVKPKFMENLISGEGLPINSSRKPPNSGEAKPCDIPKSHKTARPKTSIGHAKLSKTSSFESRASVTVSGSPTNLQLHTNRVSVVKEGSSYVRQHSRESKTSISLSDDHLETGISGEIPVISEASEVGQQNSMAGTAPVTPVKAIVKNYSNEMETKPGKKGSPKKSPHQSPRSSPGPTPTTPPLKPKPMKAKLKIFQEQNQNSSPEISPVNKRSESPLLSKIDSQGDSDSSCRSGEKEVASKGLVDDAPQKKPRLRKQKKLAQQEELEDGQLAVQYHSKSRRVKSDVNVVVIHSTKAAQTKGQPLTGEDVAAKDKLLSKEKSVEKKDVGIFRKGSNAGMKVVHIKRQTSRGDFHNNTTLQAASSSPELSRNQEPRVPLRQRSSSAFSVAHLTEFFRKKLSKGFDADGSTFYRSSKTDLDDKDKGSDAEIEEHVGKIEPPYLIYDNVLPAPEVPQREAKNPSDSLDVPIAPTDDADKSGGHEYQNIDEGAQIYGNIEIRRNTAGRNDLVKPNFPNEDESSVTDPQLNNRGGMHSYAPQLPSRGYSIPAKPSVNLTSQPTSNLDQEIVYNEAEHSDDENVYQDIGDPVDHKRKSGKNGEHHYAVIDENEMNNEEPNSPGYHEEDHEDCFFDSDDEFEEELYSKLPAFERQTSVEEEEVPLTKLGKIVKELLQTERAYVKRLHLLDQVFHFQVVLKNRVHHFFPDDIIPEMFSNIKSIYQFHNDFLLPQLERRWKDWDDIEKVGDIMKKFAPFLKLYIEYVKNFDNAMNVISSWMERSPQFATLIQDLQRHPECGNLALQHHMLEPIQRVPRYQMLLADYVKHLPEDSSDLDDAKAALDLVTKAATGSNEAMKKIETFRKLLEINESLGGVIDLVDPSRELIKEGKITKISARNGEQHERYVFLFNDFILVCQSQLIGIKQNYRVKAKLDIEGMEVQDGHNLELPNTFNVKSKSKSMEFYTSSHDEKVEWQVTLLHVVAEYHRKKMSRQAGVEIAEMFQSKELGKRAPTWVKDQETSMCMQCGTEFNKIFRRRHHCRACGKVVCGPCSKNEARLAYDGNKLNRVCANCFTTLGGIAVNGGGAVGHTNVPSPQRRKVLQVKASDPSVKSGYLHMSVDKRTWQKRWFAVHKDFVLYSFKAHQDVAAMTTLPLPGYAVTDDVKGDHLMKEHVFKLHHKDKKYYFQADNRDALKSWVSILEKVVMLELPNRTSCISTASAQTNSSQVSAPMDDH